MSSYQRAPQQTQTPTQWTPEVQTPDWDMIEETLGNAAVQELLNQGLLGESGPDASMASGGWMAQVQTPDIEPPDLQTIGETLGDSATQLLDQAMEEAGIGEGLEPMDPVKEGIEAAGSAWKDDPEGRANAQEVAKDIPNQDIIYEEIARGLAYGKGDDAKLNEWGYQPGEVVVPHDPATGLAVHAVRPRPGVNEDPEIQKMHGREIRSVLAFRGSDDQQDWADDANPDGVGEFAFSAHQGEIAAALGAYGEQGAPDVTGHSLGGALAQLACTVGSVNRCVTFQSPGIDQAESDKAEEANPELEATHHRNANDPVAFAGQTHLEGDEYIHTTDQGEVNVHSEYILGGINGARGDVVPDTTGDYSTTHVTKNGDTDGDGVTQLDEQLFDDGRQFVAETARWGAGGILRGADHVAEAAGSDIRPTRDGLAKLLNQGTKGQDMEIDPLQMEKYDALWDEIEAEHAKGVPWEDLHAHVEASGLDERLATQMKAQLLSYEELSRSASNGQGGAA